jgi:transposase-like protein
MAPRTYSEEFKRNAVDMVRGGRRINDVAAELDMPRGTLWDWVKAAEVPIPTEPPKPPASPSKPLTNTPQSFVPEATYQAALDQITKVVQEDRMLGEAAP